MFKMKPDELKKWAIYGLIAFFGFQILRFITKSKTMVEAAANNALITEQTGVSGAVLDICNEVAVNCYDAVYNYYHGAMEDEDTIIEQLNRLTTPTQARAVSLAYYNLPKHTSLKADVMKYLTGTQQKEIHSLIRSSLT